jgi:hypothetical protein
MNYSADQVWGLAVRADTVNGGYCKEAVWGQSDSGEDKMIKTANKQLVKQWLIENQQPNEAEIAQGQEVRNYFNTFTMKVLTGKINDFERQALRLAQMDEFTGRHLLEFAIISCLPETARRDRSRQELNRDIYNSEQLIGAVGDVVTGDITVVSSRYSKDYNKFKIQAWMGESFVDFWHKDAIQGELRIKGKIKQHRDNNTTQLNFVKVL